jgi:hypothetical protein
MILGREPVLFYSLVAAIVYLVTEFGVDLTSGQQAAILGLAGAILAVIARSKVTPVGNDGFGLPRP